MFSELPDGWSRVGEDVFSHTRGRARAALKDQARAVRYLAAYYRREGNYAGATFAELSPNDAFCFSPSDLLAVTMLSVEIPQVAVRRILEPGRCSAHLSRLLSDDALAFDL